MRSGTELIEDYADRDVTPVDRALHATPSGENAYMMMILSLAPRQGKRSPRARRPPTNHLSSLGAQGFATDPRRHSLSYSPLHGHSSAPVPLLSPTQFR